MREVNRNMRRKQPRESQIGSAIFRIEGDSSALLFDGGSEDKEAKCGLGERGGDNCDVATATASLIRSLEGSERFVLKRQPSCNRGAAAAAAAARRSMRG